MAGTEPSAPPPSRRRRLLFALLTLVLVALTVELAAQGFLAVMSGGWVTLAELDLRRAEVRAAEAETLPEADAAEGDVADEEAAARESTLAIRADQVLHPFLGYVIDPTQHWAGEEERFSELSGELGFPLNPHDVLQRRAPDTLIVGVFGGSVAAIFGAQRRVLAEELATYPAFAGREPIIVSLAAAGYKQPQQLMALAWLLALGGELDFVLEIDGFNEVALPPADNLPQDTSPYYPRGWRFRVGELDPATRLLAGEVAYLRRERAAWAATFSAPPWRWSRLANVVWQLGDARRRRDLGEREVALLASAGESPSGEYQSRGVMPDYPDAEAMYADLVAVWASSSRQMAALAAGSGSHYLHFLQPNQYDPGSKPLSAEERRRFVDLDHRYRPPVVAAYPLLRAAVPGLRRAGVDVVDTTRLFANRPVTLYRDACCHYNRAGNALLAARVAREMNRVWRRRGAN